MTSEVDETSADPVIDFMPDQRNLEMYGGTMRLGAYACTLRSRTVWRRAPTASCEISERHRHRYEFNNRYRPIFEEHGMRFTGHHYDRQDAPGRGGRASRRHASVVRRDAGASRVQVAAEPAVAALSRLHRCGARPRRAHRERRAGVVEAAVLDAGLITAVVLTRDEERNLPRALTSLPRGMQVFVLDACSRDHTVQFARARRCATSFSASGPTSSTRGASRCRRSTTPWTLMIDADEALDDVLCDAISTAAPATSTATACGARRIFAASRCAAGATSRCCVSSGPDRAL